MAYIASWPLYEELENSISPISFMYHLSFIPYPFYFFNCILYVHDAVELKVGVRESVVEA